MGLILVVAALAAAMWLYSMRSTDGRIIDIDDGWSITVDGSVFHDVALSDFSVPKKVYRGDTMILERDMDISGDEMYSIRLYTRLSSVVVYVDEAMIYTYMPEASTNGQFTGSGYHFVLLPGDIQGKHLKVMIKACEDGAFQKAYQVELCPSDLIYNNFAIEKELGMVISIFLVVAGFMITLIAIFSMIINEDFFPLIMIGVFAVLSGIWSLCSMKAFQFFAVPIAMGSSIEYIAMFLLPLPIISLTLWRREHMPRLERTLLQAMFWIYAFFIAAIVVLHFVDVVHFSKASVVFHIMLLFSIPLLLFVRPGHWGIMNASERMFQIGMWLTVCVGMFDIIWYYLCRFLFKIVNDFSDTVLPIGFMCMVSVLLISYLLDLYARRMNESEKNQLEKLAFHDELTGLANRARGEEILEEAKSWTDEYAIVNLDLNGLKFVNDKYGHAQGDKYITSFASALSEVFSREEIIARMGGDEFFVMLRGKERIAKLSGLITAMQQKEMELSGGLDYMIDASYGVARSNELTFPNPEALYRMADQRMYKMKMLSKRGRI